MKYRFRYTSFRNKPILQVGETKLGEGQGPWDTSFITVWRDAKPAEAERLLLSKGETTPAVLALREVAELNSPYTVDYRDVARKALGRLEKE